MTTVEAIKSFFIASGATWVMWLLFALSGGSIAVALERFLAFRARASDLGALADKLDGRLAEGDIEGALALLSSSPATAAAVARAGLRLAHLGPAAAEKGMASATAL
ncbi:MAG: MotA/TolQ/ExbB proton channel family protein, partial [Deltaproteobacteria bacterium]|nr:MotA/TolQ/ExbB proton channel family protein [Deltaproteobacteria bacterium]